MFALLATAVSPTYARPGALVGVEEAYTDNVRSQPSGQRSSDSLTIVSRCSQAL